MFKALIVFFILLTPFPAFAQMRVYTVAGDDTSTAYVTLGDGGPATASLVSSTEGIWMDGSCNLYISDMGNNRIRKVTAATGIITTIAGTGVRGYSGDGGLATNAKLFSPYGLYADKVGNVYFADRGNNGVRKIDASTGIITTIAGGGASLEDGSPATNSQLTAPSNVLGDGYGNLYVGELGRIRKVNSLGIMNTIAGTGVVGLSGDGGVATNAQIAGGMGMVFNGNGDLYFADRGNSRVRMISTAGLIITVAGTTDGYSGDGGQATAAQLSGPISLVIDYLGNIVIGDNQNDRIRKVDAQTGIITTIAGIGTAVPGSKAEGALATAADIHPEFMYLDRKGDIYYSCYCRKIRKVTNYLPSLPNTSNGCGETAVPEVAGEHVISLYPNPATNELHLQVPKAVYTACTITNTIGQRMLQQPLTRAETTVSTAALPPGMYFLTLAGDGGMKTLRFVKE